MSDLEQPIRSILIVGGGTAGWLSAAYLNRFLRRQRCRITLVESETVPTIGVGEATIPSLVAFVRNMALDEDDFMRRCHATYKLGVRFEGWQSRDHRYWHPFGVCGEFLDGLELFHFWLREARRGADPGPYWAYSLQATLAEAGRAPRPIGGTSPIIASGGYAYHLDATALAEYLRALAVAEGVRHIRDDVDAVVRDDDGGIHRVETGSSGPLNANLYLDCTGFRALLAEQALGDGWVDWSDTLLCDRAVALAQPAEPEILPFTRSRALTGGWMWQIPLANRTGTGYVFSSRHRSDEQAVEELCRASGATPGSEADARFLPMRVGYRRRFFNHNCVAIGLAGGFVEPLESTGIYLVQAAVEHLMDLFPDRRRDAILVERYNQRMEAAHREVRDFVLAHYVLCQRSRDPFWRDSAAVTWPDSLRETVALYDALGHVEPVRRGVFSATSYHHILAGNDRLPRRVPLQTSLTDATTAAGRLAAIPAEHQAIVDRLPSHRALTDWQSARPS